MKKRKKQANFPPPRKAERTPIEAGKPQKAGRKSKTTVDCGEASNPYPYLRMMAARDYQYDITQKSVADLQNTPMYRIVSLDTMRRWCAQDGWVEKRRVFLESVRKKAEERLGSSLAQAEIAQLERDQKLMDDAYDRLVVKAQKEVLEAKSWEGSVRAYVALAQMITERRVRVADMVLPEPAANLQTQEMMLPSVQPRLTQEEAAAAARTIMQMRREGRRAAAHAVEGDKDDESPPRMRVIPGNK